MTLRCNVRRTVKSAVVITRRMASLICTVCRSQYKAVLNRIKISLTKQKVYNQLIEERDLTIVKRKR